MIVEWSDGVILYLKSKWSSLEFLFKLVKGGDVISYIIVLFDLGDR